MTTGSSPRIVLGKASHGRVTFSEFGDLRPGPREMYRMDLKCAGLGAGGSDRLEVTITNHFTIGGLMNRPVLVNHVMTPAGHPWKRQLLGVLVYDEKKPVEFNFVNPAKGAVELDILGYVRQLPADMYRERHRETSPYWLTSGPVPVRKGRSAMHAFRLAEGLTGSFMRLSMTAFSKGSVVRDEHAVKIETTNPQQSEAFVFDDNMREHRVTITNRWKSGCSVCVTLCGEVYKP